MIKYDLLLKMGIDAKVEGKIHRRVILCSEFHSDGYPPFHAYVNNSID